MAGKFGDVCYREFLGVIVSEMLLRGSAAKAEFGIQESIRSGVRIEVEMSRRSLSAERQPKRHDYSGTETVQYGQVQFQGWRQIDLMRAKVPNPNTQIHTYRRPLGQ